MSGISIHLFGPALVRTTHNGRALKIEKSALRLLVFLSVWRDRVVSRECAATELWPDCDPEKARSRLSTTLWRLRKAFSRVGEDAAIEMRADGSFGLSEQTRAAVDLDQFERAATGYLNDPGASPCPEGLLDRPGETLSGWYELWAISARTRLDDLRERCLTQLLDDQIAAGLDQEAGQTAEVLLTTDPLREDVHQKLMRLHAQGGRPGLAKRQYERCRKALETDLGFAPSPETDALLSALAAPACAGRPSRMAHGQTAVLSELHRTLSETQRSLARISSRIDTLLYR